MRRFVLTCFATMAVIGPAFADAKGDLKAAREAFDNLDPRGAMSSVEKAIGSNTLKGKDLAAALAFRCRILVATGNVEPAVADADRAIELDPRQAEAQACRGAIAAAKQDLPGAIAAYGAAVELDPKNADIAVDRAALLAVSGKAADAIAAMDKVIAANPGAPAAKRAAWYTNRARMNASVRNVDAALQDLDAAIAASPEGSKALADRHFLRARLHIDRRQFDRALQDVNAALSLSTAAPPARRAILYATRGSIYASLDRHREAIADFDGAIGLVPEGPPELLGAWHANRGKAKSEAGDADGAIADLSRAIELEPNDATALSDRGNLYLRQGDLTRAAADLEAAAAMAPEDPVTHSRLAWLHVERGEYAKAVQAGDRVVAMRAKEPVALWERGIFRFLDGRFKEAAADFGMVTAAVPTNPYAAMFAHIARSKTGETGTELLAKQSDRMDKTAWPWPVVQLFLGGTEPAAVTAAAGTDAAAAAGRLAEANFYIGEWYLLQDQTQSAQEMLKRSADSGIRTLVETAAARAELKRIGG